MLQDFTADDQIELPIVVGEGVRGCGTKLDDWIEVGPTALEAEVRCLEMFGAVTTSDQMLRQMPLQCIIPTSLPCR